MVIALQVVGDVRVVVALRAGEVHAEKDAARVAREQRRVRLAVEVETRGHTGRLVRTVGGEDFAGEEVPRLVRRAGVEEELLPARNIDVLLHAALHEREVEEGREMPRVLRRAEECVHEA